MTSRRARPIVALARKPLPRHPALLLMLRARAMGPLTTKAGVLMWVVDCTPCKLNVSVSMALTPGRITGRSDGCNTALKQVMQRNAKVVTGQRALSGTLKDI